MEQIFLNLVPSGSIQTVHASKGDAKRQIEILLYDGNLPYSLKNGDVLTISVRKPDYETVTVLVSYNVGETSVIFETAEEMCDVVGKCTCELHLNNGRNRIGSLNFFMMVYDSVAETEPLPPPTPPTPVAVDPSLEGFYSKNLTAVGTLSHTFEESGTFQYISLLRLGDAQTYVAPVFKLNDELITPNTDFSISTAYFYYGEIEVNAGDVLSVTYNTTYNNSALQLAVLKDMDINVFRIVGILTNTGATFALPNKVWLLQVYKCGYYSGNNNYNYRLEYHYVTYDKSGDNAVQSIPTPNDRANWYGFTYAVVIQGEEGD